MLDVKLAYIGDDLVLEGEFAGEASLPAVKFTYHPVTLSDFAAIEDMIADCIKLKPSAFEWKVRIPIIQRHMRSWDLAKPDGTVVDFGVDTELGRIAPKILIYIFDTILRTALTDRSDLRGETGLLGKLSGASSSP